MRRSVSVTIAAVLSLLGSSLTLGLGLLMAIVLLVTGKSNPVVKEPSALVGIVVGMFFLIVPAIWGVATSIGLFLLKRWARLSILVFSVLLALMGVFSVPMMLLMPLPPTPGTDAGTLAYFRFGIAGFYFLLSAIGVWWFILFTRRSVKEQFGASYVTVATPLNSAPAGLPGRPVSITIIAWLMIVGAALAPLNWWLHPPIPFFWWRLDGWPAALYTGAYSLIALYVGIGLLRRKPVCRTLAIYLYSFGILNTLVFFLAPGREARIRAQMSWAPAFLPHPYPQFPTTFLVVSVLVGLALTLVVIYFLVTSKPAFENRPPATTPLVA
jgi:hypothetical protein